MTPAGNHHDTTPLAANRPPGRCRCAMAMCGASVRRHASAHRGFTLVEMMVSLTIISIVMSAMLSLMLLAGKAVPGTTSVADRTINASRVADRILTDLRVATTMLVSTGNTVALLTPDRNGDGEPDLVRYEWSGVVGDALTRQYLDGPKDVILSDVNLFALEFDTTSLTETYLGYLVESSELELSKYDAGHPSNFYLYPVYATAWPGQYFKPAVSADVIDWSVTRVHLLMQEHDYDGHTTSFQLWPADGDGKPSGSMIKQLLVPEYRFVDSYPAWYQVDFNVGWFDPGDGLCLVLVNASGIAAAGQVRYDSVSGSGMLWTDSSGASWTHYSTKSLHYYAYGKVRTRSADQSITRNYVTAASLSLQSGGSDAARIIASTPMLNAPELLTAQREVDFTQSPTDIDADGDTTPDWATISGSAFNPSSLVDGVWHVDQGIRVEPGPSLNQVATLEMRCRDTINDSGGGPAFAFQCDTGGGAYAYLQSNLALQSNGTQTFTLEQKVNSSTTQVLYAAASLPDAFLDLRLIVDPTLNTVNVSINGVDHGSFKYTRIAGSADPYLGVYSAGNGGRIDHVRIRVGGTSP